MLQAVEILSAVLGAMNSTINAMVQQILIKGGNLGGLVTGSIGGGGY